MPSVDRKQVLNKPVTCLKLEYNRLPNNNNNSQSALLGCSTCSYCTPRREELVRHVHMPNT